MGIFLKLPHFPNMYISEAPPTCSTCSLASLSSSSLSSLAMSGYRTLRRAWATALARWAFHFSTSMLYSSCTCPDITLGVTMATLNYHEGETYSVEELSYLLEVSLTRSTRPKGNRNKLKCSLFQFIVQNLTVQQ